MLKKEIKDILLSSKEAGWVLEPEAKRILFLSGIDIPRFTWATNLEEALQFARSTGYPLVAKVVSPKALHKSDIGGVVVGIGSDDQIKKTFHRFSKLEGFVGMLIEQMVSGLELIVGAKMDYQFGPVILLGIGGTAVEIYKDSSLRMAPLKERDVESMVKALKAHQLLEGFRGSAPINLRELTRMLMAFSRLIMQLEDMIESIDLNPVLCSPEKCIVADARIIIKMEEESVTP